MGRKKKYTTEEERKAARKEYYKEYDKARDRKEYFKEYNKTPMGRAVRLVAKYKQSDKKYNRGECTLTAKWVVDNIFPKPCIYCGESDWKKLGCDRIDNSKPHTPDNVVPCCEECNKKRHRKPFEEFLNEMQQKMLEEFENPL